MTNRRIFLKGLLGAPLLPAVVQSADVQDPSGLYDDNGNLLYMPCKVCANNPVQFHIAPDHGIIMIRGQSFEPFEVHATSEHIEASIYTCEICRGSYTKYDNVKKFEAYGSIGGVLPVEAYKPGGYQGLSLMLPTNNKATITIRHMSRTAKGLPVPGGIIRQFTPTEITYENKCMSMFV